MWTRKQPLTNKEMNKLAKEVKRLGKEEQHTLLKRLLPGQIDRDAVELEDPFIWAHALHSQTLYISNWNSMNVPFTFKSMHGTANKKALLDSGATECFLNEQMVSQLGIGTKQLPIPRKVHNVDGTKNQSGTITKYCSL
jgi:Aspartyl protease